jgi:hypothetical protein
LKAQVSDEERGNRPRGRAQKGDDKRKRRSPTPERKRKPFETGITKRGARDEESNGASSSDESDDSRKKRAEKSGVSRKRSTRALRNGRARKRKER